MESHNVSSPGETGAEQMTAPTHGPAQAIDPGHQQMEPEPAEDFPVEAGGQHASEDAEFDCERGPALGRPSSYHHRKRRASLPPSLGAPLKRQRRTFNPDYLALLNRDISDAATGIVGDDITLDLPELSQIGAVRWSRMEKEALYSALGRLGRDDLLGIAARVGTKSPLEVRQFLALLAARERTYMDEGDLWRKILRPVDIPAAAEITQDCCTALDEAADDIALRQEAHEIAVEKKRWGQGQWCITAESPFLDVVDADVEEQQPLFARLFVLRNWLRLSERIFMNSTIPEYNWRYVSEEQPAIRATALSDLHALATGITKRLVMTALFMSESRIKTRKQHLRGIRQLVKPKDVRAAAESLGLKDSSREFWARAARRLRLDVYWDGEPTEDEPDQSERGTSDKGEGLRDEEEAAESDESFGGDDGDEEESIMSYEEVEAILLGNGVQVRASHLPQQAKDDYIPTSGGDSEQTAPHMPGLGSGVESGEEPTNPAVLEVGSDSETDSDQGLDADPNADADAAASQVDGEAIQADVCEARQFAVDWSGTTRSRQTLATRVLAEHVMEAEAAVLDTKTSCQEEAQLWTVLKRPQLDSILATKRAKEEQQQDTRLTKRATFELAGKDWREAFQYVGEWETHEPTSA